MKTIRLQKIKSDKAIYKYNGKFVYHIIYDENAGRPNVYTVLAGHIHSAVTIGRELDLKWARLIISKYEKIAPDVWFGDRKDIIRCVKELYPNYKFKRIEA